MNRKVSRYFRHFAERKYISLAIYSATFAEVNFRKIQN